MQYIICISFNDDNEPHEVASRWATTLYIMKGSNCNIGFNTSNSPNAQLCGVDNAPMKKSTWDKIISDIMRDSNGCAFEFSIITTT